MSLFKSCKRTKFALIKLLKSEAPVKLSDLLMFLIFQMIVIVHFIDCGFKSGAL